MEPVISGKQLSINTITPNAELFEVSMSLQAIGNAFEYYSDDCTAASACTEPTTLLPHVTGTHYRSLQVG